MFGNIACPQLNCRNIFHPPPSKHLAAREKKLFECREKCLSRQGLVENNCYE